MISAGPHPPLQEFTLSASLLLPVCVCQGTLNTAIGGGSGGNEDPSIGIDPKPALMLGAAAAAATALAAGGGLHMAAASLPLAIGGLHHPLG